MVGMVGLQAPSFFNDNSAFLFYVSGFDWYLFEKYQFQKVKSENSLVWESKLTGLVLVSALTFFKLCDEKRKGDELTMKYS